MTHLHVIGTGLIGTSFALAARAAGCFERVTGSDIDAARLQRAIEIGAIDAQSDAPSDAPVVGAGDLAADAVLIAVPVGQVADVVVDLAASSTTTVFDVGSAKQAPVERLIERLGSVPANFVPCHPMAGSERSGPEAAAQGLFRDRVVFLMPQSNTHDEHLARVADWWRACGAEVRLTTIQEHDRAVALTSHLPHLLAAAFVGNVVDRDLDDLQAFAGPGYADFTRIAGGDPALWRDITVHNKDLILEHLGGYLEQLNALKDQLQTGDFEGVEQTLAKAARFQADEADQSAAGVRP